MEEIGLKLGEQFCDDINAAAEIGYWFILTEIKNILQLYDNDNEKLEFIESQRIKVREKLIESKYIKMCSSDEIIGDLTNVLLFFKNQEMSHATVVECSETLELGQYEYNPETRKLVVPYDPWYFGEDLNFDFAEFIYFKPLKEYIQFSMLFVELRKLEAEIKKEKIVNLKMEDPKGNNEIVDTLNTSQDKIDQGKLSQPKTIIDLLDVSESEKQYLLKYLMNTYAGKRSKFIAIMILALQETKLIVPTYNKELFEALRPDFGYIGSDEGINKILRAASRKDEALLNLVSLQSEKLRIHMENLPK